MTKNEFSYVVKQGRQTFDDPAAREQFLAKKPDGHRGFESHHRPRQSKSNPQLGYYWGFLVEEITKELIRQGFTITMNMGEHTFERYYTRLDTHDFLKGHCAKVGDDGVFVTLSEQDQELCRRYIDNVLWLAGHWLSMDREKLESKKPKLKEKAD